MQYDKVPRTALNNNSLIIPFDKGIGKGIKLCRKKLTENFHDFCFGDKVLEARVVKLHHKFMVASYMKQIAKFLALLHHNASFLNFCFIINLGFIKHLLHIFEILKFYCCLCLRSLCC